MPQDLFHKVYHFHEGSILQELKSYKISKLESSLISLSLYFYLSVSANYFKNFDCIPYFSLFLKYSEYPPVLENSCAF